MSARVPFPRIEGDAYYTPDDVAAACVRTIAPRLLAGNPPLIIEPSAGGGAFVRAVNAIGLDDTYAIDINGDAAGLGLATTYSVGDFAALDIVPPACRTWVIGNPPYSHAQQHVERAISLAMPEGVEGGGVAFLLRLAMLEGKGRALFWQAYPPTEVHILTRRPSFTGGKTDSCAYAFFVWCDGEREPVRWIP